MSSPTVDIVLVNWNSGGYLRACLEAIAKSQQNGFVIGIVTVVDNASTDRSISDLNDFPFRLRIIQNSENRGFSVGCNQGAASSYASYLLFLNPDARLSNSSLEKAIGFLENPGNVEYGICGIQLVNETGVVSRSCARFPVFLSMLSYMTGLHRVAPKILPRYQMDEWDHKESRKVDHVMGAFFLVRRSLFELLGGFDEDYFVYLEDLDFSLRAHNAGFHSYFLAEATAFHKGGGSSEQVKARRLFYHLVSRVIYVRKHFSGPSAAIVVALTVFVEPFARVMNAFVEVSPSKVMETIKAYLLLLNRVVRQPKAESGK